MATPRILLKTKKTNSVLLSGVGAATPDTLTVLSIDVGALEIVPTDGYCLVFIDALAFFNLQEDRTAAGGGPNYMLYNGGMNKSLCILYQPTGAANSKFMVASQASGSSGINSTYYYTKASTTKHISQYSSTGAIYSAYDFNPNMSFSAIHASGTRGSFVSAEEISDSTFRAYWRLNFPSYAIKNIPTPSDTTIQINVTLDADGFGHNMVATQKVYWHCEADIIIVQQDAY